MLSNRAFHQLIKRKKCLDDPLWRCLSSDGSRQRVVITGIGLITALGADLESVLKRLFDGDIGIGRLEGEEYEGLPCQVAAAVSKDILKDVSDRIGASDMRKMCRATAFSLVAAENALKDAGWLPQTPSERRQTGVAIGMGMAPLSDIIQASDAMRQSYNKLSPFFIPKILTNLAAGHISIKYGLMGPNHSVSTACSTGAHAVGDAFRFIRHGDAQLMLCGGTEANINPLAIAGFARMKALSTKFNSHPSRASRPFDRDRDGFVMGEGAGVMLLEELRHAQGRNAKIYAEVLGYGLSGDAHHVSSPSDDGEGAFLCMKAALRDAGVQPEEVGYINAHATSTPLGDAIEVGAIKRLFGPHSLRLAVSSVKGATGHLLGAAGSVEASITAVACQRGLLPPTVNLDNPDAGMDLNFVPFKSQPFPNVAKRKIAITNSFGFGGTNASLCFGSVE